MRLGLVAGAVLITVACGGGNAPSPSGPSPSPAPTPPEQPPPAPPTAPPTVANIAGAWTGHIEATHPDPAVGSTRYTITATLQQSGNQVTGTWRQPDGLRWRGEIAGTLSGFGVETTLSGSATWDAETETGTGRCFGRGKISGPAAPPFMAWDGEDVHFDTCSGALTNVRWALTRTDL